MHEPNKHSRGQAASETLVLVGFSLVFIIPIALLFLSSSTSELSKSAVIQAKAASRTIADEAGEIYLQGKGAKKTILVNYPSGVVGGSVENGLVVLTLDSDGRKMDIVSSSFANITGDISGKRTAGLQSIRLAHVSGANRSYVNITYER